MSPIAALKAIRKENHWTTVHQIIDQALAEYHRDVTPVTCPVRLDKDGHLVVLTTLEPKKIP